MALNVLVDTSAWVEYLRATGSAHDRWLQDAVEDTEVRLAWTEPVLHELASGARSTMHATELGSMLRGGPLLAVEALLDWADAATLRRRARRQGTPVRSVSDALIATVAVRSGTPVLARDRDFAHLAAVSDLRLIEPCGLSPLPLRQAHERQLPASTPRAAREASSTRWSGSNGLVM